MTTTGYYSIYIVHYTPCGQKLWNRSYMTQPLVGPENKHSWGVKSRTWVVNSDSLNDLIEIFLKDVSEKTKLLKSGGRWYLLGIQPATSFIEYFYYVWPGFWRISVLNVKCGFSSAFFCLGFICRFISMKRVNSEAQKGTALAQRNWIV